MPAPVSKEFKLDVLKKTKNEKNLKFCIERMSLLTLLPLTTFEVFENPFSHAYYTQRAKHFSIFQVS